MVMGVSISPKRKKRCSGRQIKKEEFPEDSDSTRNVGYTNCI